MARNHIETARGTGSEFGSRRRVQPLNQLLPTTTKWLESIPAEIRPHALAHTFPRIANALARSWPDQAALRECLDELLIDRRGGRRGFPPEVHSELLVLRDYCQGRYSGAAPPG